MGDPELDLNQFHPILRISGQEVASLFGGGFGTGIDAFIEGQRVVYARSKSTVTVAPLIDRDRTGVMLTLRR